VGEMLSVSGYRGVERKEYDFEERKRSVDELAEYRVVRVGQLVVNTMWLNYAGLAVSAFEGHVSPAYRCYEIARRYEREYLHHLVRSATYVGRYCALLYGIRPNSLQIKNHDWDSLELLVPPRAEQRAIAAFLDRETARIDALVAKKERLIALLQEQRTALITRAVTKGLDPTVPMKDSGVEWLGEIPAHWEVKRLRHLGDAIIGLTYEPDDVVGPDNGGTLVLRASNVNHGRVVFDDNVYVRRTIPEHLRTRLGDILICSRSGSRALIGKCALIDACSTGMTFGTFMTIFRSSHNAFLFYVLNSTIFDYQSGLFLTSTINQLTVNSLKDLTVPVPPEEEQAVIAQAVGRETGRIDALVAKVRDAIDRLKELRTALISAAVTGKIDVREEVA